MKDIGKVYVSLVGFPGVGVRTLHKALQEEENYREVGQLVMEYVIEEVMEGFNIWEGGEKIHVYLLCVALNELREKEWVKPVESFYTDENAPIILVGTKADLEMDKRVLEQAEQFAFEEDNKIVDFVNISSQEQLNLNMLLATILKAINRKYQSKSNLNNSQTRLRKRDRMKLAGKGLLSKAQESGDKKEGEERERKRDRAKQAGKEFLITLSQGSQEGFDAEKAQKLGKEGEYEGEKEKGKPNGKGKMKWQNGGKFEGVWKEGEMKEGRVSLGESWYEGEMKGGVRSGKGVMRYWNGGGYEGEWVNDMREGKGVYTSPSGETFNGTWEKGKLIEGKMEKKNEKGGVVYSYKGKFKGGLREGRGIMVNQDSMYDGDWERGRKHGEGSLFISENMSYNGEFVNDYPHGQGTLQLGETRYIATWNMGKMEGECVIKKGGEKLKGEVHEGKFVGEEKMGECFVPPFPKLNCY